MRPTFSGYRVATCRPRQQIGRILLAAKTALVMLAAWVMILGEARPFLQLAKRAAVDLLAVNR